MIWKIVEKDGFNPMDEAIGENERVYNLCYAGVGHYRAYVHLKDQRLVGFRTREISPDIDGLKNLCEQWESLSRPLGSNYDLSKQMSYQWEKYNNT